MSNIAFINQKGGTGKTTSTVNIGAGLTRLKKKVLIIDFDPQSNATYHLGIRPQNISGSIMDIMEKRAIIEDAIIKKNGPDIIPATLTLAEIETRILNVTGREHLLRESLAEIKSRYDFILVDCPPSLGILTVNALVACTDVYIPLEAQALPLQGLKTIQKIVDIVRTRLNSRLRIAGIILTRFDHRRRLDREVMEITKEHFGPLLFKTIIRENVKLAEAPSHGHDIFHYAPRSHGAEDYLNLCREIIRRSNV